MAGLPINYNGAEVSPMNSKTGVMGKISRILNKDITAEQKMKEYETCHSITEAQYKGVLRTFANINNSEYHNHK